ncbi:MAG: FtsX-like permease family protein [Lentimicrobiaceae bacterium]|jgi:ABC-type lipoprotein release transport system permease subunit
MIFSIAWKNIWRNKLRSLIVIAATTIGVAAGTFSAALMFGVATQKVNSSISNEVSHIQIHNPNFRENYEFQYSLPEAEKMMKAIARLPEVKSVAPRTIITGMIMSAASSSGIKLSGIDPEIEKKTTTLYTKIADTSGVYFGEGLHNPIVISQKLADKLNVRLKSKLILRFQSADGSLIEGAFKICGIYHTSNGMFDEINVFIRQSDLGSLIGSVPVHEIAILLHNDLQTTEVFAILKKSYPALEVLSWKELLPEIGMITAMLGMMNYFILGIILAALAFGIVNTMLMIVLERSRELGMLLAIGMNKNRLFRMIMLESILLSLCGGAAGMIISTFIIWLTSRTGIDLSSFSKGFESLGFDPVMYPEIRPAFYLGTVLMVIITGVLSSLYPARKALGINPALAVKNE